ncbi:response regulator [Deinococcus sp. QL22]|uniref:response regulator n=1 Tax=Deinococcus sp. QL22 TaxID=2939437 RepID=UPI00201802A6|nr:response regulator [Deinococcus sp. QL22]UQN09796.1 response regulator [Deinococcus sp. QL22]
MGGLPAPVGCAISRKEPDLDLPHGFGMPLVHRVLTLVEPTPVVILSGQDNEASEAQAAALGVHAYLVKSQEAVRTLVAALRLPQS